MDVLGGLGGDGDLDSTPRQTRQATIAEPKPGRHAVIGSRRAKQVPKGENMADKSPRQHMSKKAGKSLKEKRAEKRLKAEAKSKTPIVPPGKQR